MCDCVEPIRSQHRRGHRPFACAPRRQPAQIARREGKVEPHVRLLAPLSPFARHYLATLPELRPNSIITGLGLSYVAGIQSHTTVWASGTGPRPPKKWSGHGRASKLLRGDDKHKPASVKELALALPKRAWRTITWREATGDKLSSRFARVRVRVAHRDCWLADGRGGSG